MAYIGATPQNSLQQYLTIDDISGSFNGVLTSFALQVGGVAPVPGPSQSNQLLISLGGVIQEPDDTGSAGFRLSGGNIIFSSAPAGSTAFFGVVLAGADYIFAGTNFPDGSVTTPSITFANDLDSGFYRTGSGELAYTSNGAFRLKIDSSGRLGVGTSSPSTRLHVLQDTNAAQLRIESTSSGNRAQGTFINAHSQWDVGVAGGTTGQFLIATATENVGLGIYTRETGQAQSEKVTITSAGRVGVGTTSPNRQLVVNGGASEGVIQITNNTSGTAVANCCKWF
jgi:hypothetical protein